MTSMRVIKPDAEADVHDAIRDAARVATPLAIEGNGTKRSLGRTVGSETVLRMAGLTGITMYEPAEMVFSARAGTPMEEIEAALAAHGQCLGFEPGDHGPLWGEPPDRGTIGGVVAAGLAGPRRFAAGAARDHLLGFTAINGKGERFKAGGRVVKNVTGYDLPKLAAGSFGTLFVMVDVTLRAVPRGVGRAVLGVEGLKPSDALSLLRTIAGTPFEPTGLAYLPATVAARIHEPPLAVIRLEGQADGVKARAEELQRGFAPTAKILDQQRADDLFRAIGDAHPLFERDTAICRLSIPPSRADQALAALKPKSWFADWAGGALWLEFDRAANAVHDAARSLGGHATFYRAAGAPADLHVFPPCDAATMALTRQLKHAFDPQRILNPGRMYAGA